MKSNTYNEHVFEGLSTPLQEKESLAVALKLQGLILGLGLSRAHKVHLNRVVDHQVGGAPRVDEFRVAAQLLDGVSHGGKVDDRRDAGVVLQDDARRTKRHLDPAAIPGGSVGLPVQDLADVGLLHLEVVAVSDGRLEEHADGERESGVLGGVEGGDVEKLASALQGLDNASVRRGHFDVVKRGDDKCIKL